MLLRRGLNRVSPQHRPCARRPNRLCARASSRQVGRQLAKQARGDELRVDVAAGSLAGAGYGVSRPTRAKGAWLVGLVQSRAHSLTYENEHGVERVGE